LKRQPVPILALAPPFITPSVATTVPSSGCNLKFCPESVTNRILSTVGLKSTDALVVAIVGERGRSNAVATPLFH
jgi:hypothetical protein